MKTEIETAIKVLAEKAKEAKQPHEAMQFAQAALNLAHTAETVANTKKLFWAQAEHDGC